MKRLLPLAALLAALVAPAAAPASERDAARYLERVRDDAARRHAFLYDMPKGADLHNHLSGAVYAETIVQTGAQDGDCVDLVTYTASQGPCQPGQRPIADAFADNDLYNAILRAWSMKGFEPGEVSGHDHFFATFDRFGAALSPGIGVGLAEVTSRAAAQNEQYLETLRTPSFGITRGIATQVGWDPDLAALREKLLAAGLTSGIAPARADLDAVLAQQRAALRCGTVTADAACDLPVRFQVQVLRGMPKEVVFAQLVLGFELMAADPRWVAVNLVQPEDGPTALADYRLHMRMIRMLRAVYPAGHVTLHAGELVPGLAPPADLRFHVREAVTVAGAERIGHGVDIRWERRPIALMRRMARDGVLVEVPLTSNRQILEVSGRRHPIRLYLKHGVPVALATDDEGVSRTDLTAQFEQAVTDHDLGYLQLKQMALDSLEHAFLPDGEKATVMRTQAAAFARFEARFDAPEEVTLPRRRIEELPAAVAASDCTLRRFPIEGDRHVAEEVEYGTNPPTSGDHSPIPAEDGIHPPRRTPSSEEVVHALEHGRIVFQYRPDAGARTVATLEAIFRERVNGARGYHALVLRNETGMRPPVAATAWGRMLTCPELDGRAIDALRAFRERFTDQAPEFVP